MLWKWKLARDLDDVLHLLNGETKYDHPVPDARVCMTWRGDHPQFWVFARKAAKIKEPHDGLSGWGWKLATDADDALHFLRGDGPYAEPVGQAQIAAAWAGDHYRFYVFYRRPLPGQEPDEAAPDWGWRLTTEVGDTLRFLNGAGSYPGPVRTARIAGAHRSHGDEYFVFYQRSGDTHPVDDWRWCTVTSADAVRESVDRKGEPPLDFQVVAPPAGQGIFQVFTRPAPPLCVGAAQGSDRLSSG